MEPVTFGMAGFSLMSGMGGIGLTASATATAVTTAATATTAASMVLYWGVGHLGSWGCTAKVPWPIGWRVCRTNGWSTETWQKKLSIEQQARIQCQACPFVVRYYGPVYRGKDTVLGMEILQDLCSTYSNAGLWGNEEHVKMHIACVAEALAFAHARNIWQRDIKHKTFCWTHRVIILGLRKWARLTGHGPASELLNTGPELVQGAGYNEAVDWWALGCVLFELCSRKQLFPGKAHPIVIFDPSSPNSFSGCHCRDAVRLLKCLRAAKPLKSDPRGRNQAARLVWRFWMAAFKARQREISVPDLVDKAYYNCSCFFSSLLPKCFGRLFQSDANSEWRGNCHCEGKVSSEGFKEDVTHASFHKQPPAAAQRKNGKLPASYDYESFLESTEPDPEKVSPSTSLATPDPLFHAYTNADTPWDTLSVHS